MYFFQVVAGKTPADQVSWQALVGPIPLQAWRKLRAEARESPVMVAVGSTVQGRTGFYVGHDMSLVYAEVLKNGSWRMTKIK